MSNDKRGGYFEEIPSPYPSQTFLSKSIIEIPLPTKEKILVSLGRGIFIIDLVKRFRGSMRGMFPQNIPSHLLYNYHGMIKVLDRGEKVWYN